MSPAMIIDIRVALFLGAPLEGGRELEARGYRRAEYGSISVALADDVNWGISNTERVIFGEAEEEWTDFDHAVLMAGPDAVVGWIQMVEDSFVPAGASLSFLPYSLTVLVGQIKFRNRLAATNEYVC